MKISKVAIFCKKSAYQFYFLEHRGALLKKEGIHFSQSMRTEFKRAHGEHYRTIAFIENALRERKIKFVRYYRGQRVDFKPFGLVIAIGGDGTFLEAARHVKEQIILGVNSDPKRSIGRLCASNRGDFKNIFEKLIRGKCKVRILNRIKLRLRNDLKGIDVLNDILIRHQNPASMSRYRLSINGLKEEQRSSGVWISTPVGSSGAIRAAGGRLMPKESSKIQYKPRELFEWHNTKYRLRGGIVALRRPMLISSLMRNGMIYVDGSHLKIPFNFGNQAYLSLSEKSLKVVGS